MPDLRNGRNWDRQFEMGLPDCRVRREDRDKTIVMRGPMAFETVYCANCGTLSGLVTAEWTAHVFYVCDGCVNMCGTPPGTVEVPAPPGTRQQ